MADKTTTKFTKMGESIPRGGVVNISGAPSKNTKSVKKTGNSKGGMIASATANHRPGIQERMGAQLHPSATLYAPNAAASSDLQRNTRIVPSSLGNRDFFAKRSEARIG
jgi:hypothetical protein